MINSYPRRATLNMHIHITNNIVSVALAIIVIMIEIIELPIGGIIQRRHQIESPAANTQKQ